MRIALLGSNGQLGNDLTIALSEHDLRVFTREHFDVTDHVAARVALIDVKPELILNTTAYHRVDDCETQPELAYGSNVFAVLNLVRVANELNATLVHISTDYVFDGRKRSPYTEDDLPFPLSIYGNSKLAGEYLVRTTAKKYFLIRSCGLYGKAGSRGKGGNFVETILKKAKSGDSMRVVNDQTVTPTSTASLAEQIAELVRTQRYGLYHMTNEGQCSWYEFAAAICEIAGIKADIAPTTSELYKAPALRPQYSVLANSRLQEMGLNHMPHWRDALTRYIRT